MRRLFYCVCLVMCGGPGPAGAEPLLGLWLTRPDMKGQVAHVEASRCGQFICGTILRSYDRSGQPVVTPHLGKRLFWDMVHAGDGLYRGTGWLPLRDRTFPAEARVDGNRLTVRGCIGPICQTQVWTRLP